MKTLVRTVCLVFTLLVFCGEAAFSQVSQVLIPKEVFSGDEARIQYKFESHIDFYDSLESSVLKDGTLSLDLKKLSKISGDCTIKGAVLSRDFVEYTLTLVIVPWRPGEIVFEPFDLFDVCGSKSASNSEFLISLEPVTIASLSQKLGVNTLRPQIGPLLLPGTNYVILFAVIVLIVLVLLVFTAVIKMHGIISAVKKWRTKYGLYKNARLARKRLKLLGNEKYTDAEFSKKWQTLMREYLDMRFDVRLLSVPSSRIVSVIGERTSGLLDDKVSEELSVIASFFIRTDYMRYAQGSLDSFMLPVEEHRTEFLKGERKEIVKKSIAFINIVESQKEETEK